jgi:hypothetical protein
MGQSVATNHGVYQSSYNNVFISNDDNVFPKDWSTNLIIDYNSNIDVMTPNQIEPSDSMFKQFIKHDFGKTIDEFNINKFYEIEISMRKDKIDECGSTLPYLISKYNFLKTGGWDERYPSGNVVDWECMLKYQLCGLKMKRTYRCNFYHFTSISFKSEEKIKEQQKQELEGFEYFKYKWGAYPKHDPVTNLKSL